MAFSRHIPLGLGILKVKTASLLRREERNKEVPMWRVGHLCFVWQKRKTLRSGPAVKDDMPDSNR